MPKTEEKYLEWLERMDFDVEDELSKENLRKALERELGYSTDKMAEALWERVQYEDKLGKAGIRAVDITYPWGHEVRYTIEGRRGLFGEERMLRIFKGEE